MTPLLVAILCSTAVAADPVAVSRASAGSLSRKGLTGATSPGQWTWAGGPDRIAETERVGVYGTKGVAAPENVPGARHGATTWLDASGNFWLFGGRGFARIARDGTLNDLWKWDGTSWTWVSGSDESGRIGTYGEQGVAAPGNEPGARYGAVSWSDGSGNLWIFGGEGIGSVRSFDVRLSDLWKWDGTNWTWVSGPNVGEQPGVYGTLGVAALDNRPGGRRDTAAWSDSSGNFWLFGGIGYGASSSWTGNLNDLWKWDGSAWTWMGGSSSFDAAGVYGTKGVASPTNVPGGRYGASVTVGSDGTIWLFGGSGRSEDAFGWLNDLWSWDGGGWVWISGSNSPDQPSVYGTKAVSAPGNVPGARVGAASWMDASGNLFVLGGAEDRSAWDWKSVSDIWKWDGVSWTWIGGANAPNQPGIYGTKNVPDAGNEPGARYDPAVSRDASGSVYLFGGLGASATGRVGVLNDLWRWNGAQWTWMSGSNGESQAGVYGVKGVASPGNHPGARSGAVTWRTTGGETWVFGGYGYSARGLGYLNDLWRWDGADWTWFSGADFEDQPGEYGTKGAPAATNVPGARSYAVSWTDASGNLWLFGGVDDPWEQSLRNDLWKWDGANWTWVSGSQNRGHPGSYGTKGVPAPTNAPSCRHSAVAWTDASGGLWLFGGNGWPVSDGAQLNDLWRWDGTNWTWMSGSNNGNTGGYFGSRGVPAPENTPPGRVSASAWVDQNGHFWLFGGTNYGYYAHLNDLWRWDGTYWTWMSGSDRAHGMSVHGTLGISAPGIVPGARYGASSWTDSAGSLWLLGGYGRSVAGTGYLNDLWRWDGAYWTWMSGSKERSQSGVYGDLGLPSPENTPGGRYEAASWSDEEGHLWLLGGEGGDSTNATGTLRDLWVYEPPSCSPPMAAITAPDSILEGSGPHSASVADAGAGFIYEWTITGGMIDAGQGTPAVTILATPGETSVVLGVVVRKGDCAASWEKTIPVGVYYRLDVVRNGVFGDLVHSSSSPPEISCGLSCSAIYAPGALVTLYARAGSGSRFAGWLGAGCSGTGTCVVTVNEPTTVSATFLQQAASGFYPVTPCRIADTRNAAGPYGAPALEAGASRAFTVAETCGVPADATAVALNVTVTAPTDAGSLTLFPGTGLAPNTGVVSFAAGRTRASNVTMGLVGGVLSVLDRQETGTVDLILDVSGYYR